MSGPLIDTLFRPTTLTPIAASAAPVRERGTRTRAGNAMGRTRSALMAGAAAAVTRDGTHITMAQVAVEAGVAKATLYNHFRTREAVLAALVAHEVATIVEACRPLALPEALAQAARAISDHPVRAGLAQVEPAVLAQLGRIDSHAEGWRTAADAVAELLADRGAPEAPLLLRWLASFVLSPASAEEIQVQVSQLLGGAAGAADVPTS